MAQKNANAVAHVAHIGVKLSTCSSFHPAIESDGENYIPITDS